MDYIIPSLLFLFLLTAKQDQQLALYCDAMSGSQEAVKKIQDWDVGDYRSLFYQNEVNHHYLRSTNNELERDFPINNKEDRLFYFLNLSNHLTNQKSTNDSLIYSFLKKAEELSKEKSLSGYQPIVYQKLCHYYISKFENRDTTIFKYYQGYIQSLEQSATQPYHHYYANYYKSHVQLAKAFVYEEGDISNPSVFDDLLAIHLEDPYYNGYAKQLAGIYYSYYLDDQEKTKELHNDALQQYQDSDSASATEKAIGIQSNEATRLFYLEEFKEALTIYGQCLQQYQSLPNQMDNELIINDWLMKTYTKLNEKDSIIKYTNAVLELRNAISNEEKRVKVFEVETAYSVKEKEETIVALGKSKDLFKWQVFLLTPLALLLTWLAYRYYSQYQISNTEKTIIQSEYEDQVREKTVLESSFKKIQSQVAELEQEREETIDRLEHLKEVVTKDFIILKDKSKVYVEELMFIQSDGHYLRVHLHNKKDNFVRGKISTIIEELPPNFIRCHRSYIINENYIEKILTNSLRLTDGNDVPVSKKYREIINQKNK